mmetsp:Transcript_1918/g.4466  ORF Transcript_1918/g.4466 Transcript_1918/m.4466 type:complete len:412 (-) Transcript_1918:428-1663(-)
MDNQSMNCSRRRLLVAASTSLFVVSAAVAGGIALLRHRNNNNDSNNNHSSVRRRDTETAQDPTPTLYNPSQTMTMMPMNDMTQHVTTMDENNGNVNEHPNFDIFTLPTEPNTPHTDPVEEVASLLCRDDPNFSVVYKGSEIITCASLTSNRQMLLMCRDFGVLNCPETCDMVDECHVEMDASRASGGGGGVSTASSSTTSSTSTSTTSTTTTTTTVIVAPEDRRPSESYSWYCGWDELAPFWTMLVPDTSSRVVIAGIGNDPSPVQMYDAGWTNMMAYDYSRRGVDRARELFAPSRDGVELLTADATDLPLETSSVDATLDKGTLDAIFITGEEIFRRSVREMGRVTAEGGRVVSVSTVVNPDVLLGEFDTVYWENVHDGSLAFAEDGEATIDLGAELYSWKRTGVPFVFD